MTRYSVERSASISSVTFSMIRREQRVEIADRRQRAADLLDQRDLLLLAAQRGLERLHRVRCRCVASPLPSDMRRPSYPDR